MAKIKASVLALLCFFASTVHAQATASVQVPQASQSRQSSLIFDGFVVVKVLFDSEKDSTYRTCPVSSELVVLSAGPFDTADKFRCEMANGSNNKSVLVVKTVDQLLAEEMGPNVRAMGVLPMRNTNRSSPRMWTNDKIMVLYKKN